jgi:hypothetical protein
VQRPSAATVLGLVRRQHFHSRLPLGATLVAFRGLAIWQAIIVAIVGAAGSFAVVGSSRLPAVAAVRRA